MSALEYIAENRLPVYVGIAAIMLASILAYVMLHTSRPQPAPPPPIVTMVVIQPPKPPPPPPPLPQPKTIVQPKMTVPQPKPIIPNQPPKPAPPKPASSAPALGTSLKSNGTSNAFDLSGNGSGNGIIGGSGTGGGGGGSYGDAVSTEIQQALENNPVTRRAAAGLVVRIWISASGAVTRVELEKSSGNAAMDNAIQNKVLSGLTFYPPPPDTPMPVEMSLTGEQPLQ